MRVQDKFNGKYLNISFGEDHWETNQELNSVL